MAAIGLMLATVGTAQAAATYRMSEFIMSWGSDEYLQQGNRDSHFARISANGAWVAFMSEATNLGAPFSWDAVFVVPMAGGYVGWLTGDVEWPSLSSTGAYLAYQSLAQWGAFDYNGMTDVFVRDNATGYKWRESVSDGVGMEGNGDSFHPSISRDAQIVAYASWANNLVAGDTNGRTDIFARDDATRTTERVSVSSAELEANGDSWEPSASSTGRYIAFTSDATNLVADDGNDVWDIFVRDRTAGTTERVSVTTAGGESNGNSYFPCISGDGRYITFTSDAGNLVDGDGNGQPDVFIHDRTTHRTERVSVSSSGEEGYHWSQRSWLSDDGRYVAFGSMASNLVDGDTNNAEDIFLRDRTAGTTQRVSVSTAGLEADGPSFAPCMSSGGRFITFESDATNLVDNDTNGVRDVFVRDRLAAGQGEGGDTTPPGDLAISINGGDECTNSPAVVLTLAATEAQEMRLRNEGGEWSAWEPLAASKAWALSAGRGLKKVWFQCRDSAGNESEAVADEIAAPLFDDVPCGHPARRCVEALVRAQIAGGCSRQPPLFCPGAPVTRGQVAKLLCLAAGKTWLDRATPTFADVPKSHPFYGWVERLTDAASWGGRAPTNGCQAAPLALYCPGAPVSREQMAKFLCLAAGKEPMPACSGMFADVLAGNGLCRFIERVADPASWPGGVAVTNGCPCPQGAPAGARCFCPRAAVTRAQMAAFLCRAFGLP